MTAHLDLTAFKELVLQEDDDPTPPSVKPANRTHCQAILNHIPFVIPFEVRVSIFRQWVRLDRERCVPGVLHSPPHVLMFI